MIKEVETIYIPLELPINLFVVLQRECYRKRTSKQGFILTLLEKNLEKELKKLVE